MESLNITIASIVTWYNENVNITLDEDFFNYLIKIGMLSCEGTEKGLFPLSKINKLMLIHENGEPIKNDEGKYMVKENRIIAINKVKESEKTMFDKDFEIPKVNNDKKFKITKLSGNKLKLIKI